MCCKELSLFRLSVRFLWPFLVTFKHLFSSLKLNMMEKTHFFRLRVIDFKDLSLPRHSPSFFTPSSFKNLQLFINRLDDNFFNHPLIPFTLNINFADFLHWFDHLDEHFYGFIRRFTSIRIKSQIISILLLVSVKFQDSCICLVLLQLGTQGLIG